MPFEVASILSRWCDPAFSHGQDPKRTSPAALPPPLGCDGAPRKAQLPRVARLRRPLRDLDRHRLAKQEILILDKAPEELV
jgi:hypothetical protein